MLAPEAAHSAMITRYDFARRAVRGGSVLEVACGTGIGLAYLARDASEVAGLDIDPDNVARARALYRGRFDVRQGDACALPFPDERFDCVVILDAIYWLDDAREFVREARRVLRPGGRLVITTLSIEWVGWSRGWAAPRSTRYWKADELRTMLVDEGFSVDLGVGFRDDGRGPKKLALIALRKLLFASPFAPRTLKGRERIKRLIYRSMRPFPESLVDGHAEVDPITPLGNGVRLREYHMLYILAIKP